MYFSRLLAFTCLLASTASLAMPDAPPSHSFSPTLNGLNIATLVKKDRVKITLYVVNHETFPVLCDAQYSSGPEKQDAPEITLPANKADAFKFVYGRRGDSVSLNLICINPDKKPSVENPSDVPL